MNKYKIILQSQPEKYFRKADINTRKVLNRAFERIRENPFYYPGKIIRLKGRGCEGLFRYATNGLRIVYEIDGENKTVGIFLIKSRGDVYKKL